MTTTAAPMFDFGGRNPMPIKDGHVRTGAPRGQLSLAGPSPRVDPTRLAVRGDLAHVALAGRCFVPHYAEPMAHVVKSPGATLRASGKAGARDLATLHAGTVFEVLDIAGGWAWGQVGDDGLVGYLPMPSIEPS
ncbi:MAG: SH3 domain-containing protein [Novosphingobium sp.]